MEIVRIPNRYKKQLHRLTDKQRLFIFDSLINLSLGEDVSVPDDLSGDTLELIWRDAILMEKKNGNAGVENVGELLNTAMPSNPAGDPAGIPTPEGNGREGKGNDVKGKSHKPEKIIQQLWNVLEPQNKPINPSCQIGKKIFPQCTAITETIKTQARKRVIAYGLESVCAGILQYAEHILKLKETSSGYHEHRFSLSKFLQQKNGIEEFIG